MSYNYTSFSFPNSETKFYTGNYTLSKFKTVSTIRKGGTSYVFKHEIYEQDNVSKTFNMFQDKGQGHIANTLISHSFQDIGHMALVLT